MTSKSPEPTCPRHESAPNTTLVPAVSRRSVLKAGMATAGVAVLGSLGELALKSNREAWATSPPPDIQFDLGNFIPPAAVFNDGAGNVTLRFATVFTTFATYHLTRTPSHQDQAIFAGALASIESAYLFSPSGVFTIVSYGLPYFNRLPQAVVQG